jgi:hypothetical protein
MERTRLELEFDLYLEQYELPALESCLDTTTFDKLKINLGRSQKFLEKLRTGDPFGIVSRVTKMSEFRRIDSAALFTRTVNSSTVFTGVSYTICFKWLH